jgi:GGDEF-like domain
VRLVEHGGDTIGQHSQLLMVPERDFALVLLTNCGPNGPQLIDELQRWTLEAAEAVGRLGFSGRSAVVLAFALADEPASASIARVEAARRRAADAFALHLSAMHPGTATALVGGVTYGILPATREEADAQAWAQRLAADFLDRVGDHGHGVIGIGRPAHGVAGLARSRADADRALRVLRAGGPAGRGQGGRRPRRGAPARAERPHGELGVRAGRPHRAAARLRRRAPYPARADATGLARDPRRRSPRRRRAGASQ